MIFGLGMCMSMLPQWGMMGTGRIVGAIGILMLLLTVFVWRRMEHKPRLHLSVKTVGITLLTAAGALLLGVGMCLSMVWGCMAAGIVVGMAGIVALLCLIPLVKGFR